MHEFFFRFKFGRGKATDQESDRIEKGSSVSLALTGRFDTEMFDEPHFVDVFSEEGGDGFGHLLVELFAALS